MLGECRAVRGFEGQAKGDERWRKEVQPAIPDHHKAVFMNNYSFLQRILLASEAGKYRHDTQGCKDKFFFITTTKNDVLAAASLCTKK